MWTGHILKARPFESDDHAISLSDFLASANQIWSVIVSFLNSSSWRSVNGKHLMRFQSENSVFNFLRRSVYRKHLMRFQRKTSVFKFLRRSVNRKHLMCFQRETSVFKFLQRSVDGKHLICFQSVTSVFKFLQRIADGALSESTITHLSVFSHCIHFDFTRTFNELCHHNRMILNSMKTKLFYWQQL